MSDSLRTQAVEAMNAAMAKAEADWEPPYYEEHRLAAVALDALLGFLSTNAEAWALRGQVDVAGKGWFAPPEITNGLIAALQDAEMTNG